MKLLFEIITILLFILSISLVQRVNDGCGAINYAPTAQPAPCCGNAKIAIAGGYMLNAKKMRLKPGHGLPAVDVPRQTCKQDTIPH